MPLKHLFKLDDTMGGSVRCFESEISLLQKVLGENGIGLFGEGSPGVTAVGGPRHIL